MVIVESTNQTFEDFSSTMLRYYDGVEYFNNFISSHSDLQEKKSFKSQRTTLAGLPAWQMIEGNSTWVRSELWTVKNNHAYHLMSEADIIDTEVYIPTFGKMWDSFEIIR